MNMTNNTKDKQNQFNIYTMGEWLKVGGGFVFICTVVFMAGVFVKEAWSNTESIKEIKQELKESEKKLSSIEKSINDLTNKIDGWQHQAEVFKKLEQKVWESFTKK